jgi:hypothetical protein
LAQLQTAGEIGRRTSFQVQPPWVRKLAKIAAKRYTPGGDMSRGAPGLQPPERMKFVNSLSCDPKPAVGARPARRGRRPLVRGRDRALALTGPDRPDGSRAACELADEGWSGTVPHATSGCASRTRGGQGAPAAAHDPERISLLAAVSGLWLPFDVAGTGFDWPRAAACSDPARHLSLSLAPQGEGSCPPNFVPAAWQC